MEIWDLYDEQKNKVGLTHVRGEKIPDGYYHMAVYLFIVTSNKKALITQRSIHKSSYSLMYECSGGSLLQGEDGKTGAIRELLEETGLVIDKSAPTFFKEVWGDDWVLEYYYAIVDDFDVSNLTLQEEEVSDAKLVDLNELKLMEENNMLVNDIYDSFEEIITTKFND